VSWGLPWKEGKLRNEEWQVEKLSHALLDAVGGREKKGRKRGGGSRLRKREVEY